MAQVYLAEREQDGLQLVLKVLDPNLLMEAMHLGVKEFIPLPMTPAAAWMFWARISLTTSDADKPSSAIFCGSSQMRIE